MSTDSQLDWLMTEPKQMSSTEKQFETFWSCYPRKTAKGSARDAFKKAIKKTSLDKMLKAITSYVANKPDYSDYKHPATWLNQECWDDEWEPQQAKPAAGAFKTSAQRHQTREEYLAAERRRAERSWS